MGIALKQEMNHKIIFKSIYTDTEICNSIIKLKNDKEDKETFMANLFMNIWETIAGEHYYTRDNHYGKYSYIFDTKKYVVKPDLRIHFYQMTGISSG